MLDQKGCLGKWSNKGIGCYATGSCHSTCACVCPLVLLNREKINIHVHRSDTPLFQGHAKQEGVYYVHSKSTLCVLGTLYI